MLRVMRHAESLSNIGFSRIIDCDLSPNGIQQASKITGHYDLVICSTLKRARRTLECSKITYDKVKYDDNIRERVLAPSDCLLNEIFVIEDEVTFRERIKEFMKEINMLENKKILVITHLCFIQEWLGISWLNNGGHIEIKM